MEGSWGRRGDEGAPATTPYALNPKASAACPAQGGGPRPGRMMELRRGLEKALHSDRVLEDNRCFVDKRPFFLFIEAELAHVVMLSSHIIRKVRGSRIASPCVAFKN